MCREGLTRLDLGGLIICDEDATFEEPETTDGPETDLPTQTIGQPTQGTQPPAPTEGPTFPGGLKACPTDLSSYQQNDYVYSSL